ncbi:IstB-like ATP-binding protein [Anopheles sinensis]|uniref:IstB-like ATP-binding protein n=1 Tax=Anopheles sinensis TaxID=74873 RepID=A0A084VQ79_ANOSI|nr:IstB-like ATP-binding protein [Anopheles sinensis]
MVGVDPVCASSGADEAIIRKRNRSNLRLRLGVRLAKLPMSEEPDGHGFEFNPSDANEVCKLWGIPTRSREKLPYGKRKPWTGGEGGGFVNHVATTTEGQISAATTYCPTHI